MAEHDATLAARSRQGTLTRVAGFVTGVPNSSIGEVFQVGSGASFRILEKRTEIAAEYIDAGFNGAWVVEPVDA
jgi:hypothetical protein